MRRRQFLQSTVSVASSALLPRYARAEVACSAPSTLEVAALDGGARTVSCAALKELQSALYGALLLPRDPGYEDARRIVNSRFDKHPAFIVQATGAADVALAVTFARENGLLLAVKGGGHNEFGVSTCEGGMMLDLSPLRAIRIDTNARRAWVAGATLAGLIDHEAGKRGYGDCTSSAPNDLYIELFLAARADPKDGQLKLNVCFLGAQSQAERVLQPLRRFGQVLRDEVKAVSYPVAQGAGAHASARTIVAGPATGFYGSTGFLEGLGVPLAAAIVESLAGYPDPHVNMLFLQGGGAISRPAAGATAFSHRGVSHDMAFAASWKSGEGADNQLEFARKTWARLQTFTRGFYVNDMAGAVTAADVALNYGGNAARLAAVKARYDPQNLFRLNANILPGAVP